MLSHNASRKALRLCAMCRCRSVSKILPLQEGCADQNAKNCSRSAERISRVSLVLNQKLIFQYSLFIHVLLTYCKNTPVDLFLLYPPSVLGMQKLAYSVFVSAFPRDLSLGEFLLTPISLIENVTL